VDVINDDNEPEVSIFATIPNAAEPATNGQFTVTRSGSTASALTVFYVTGGSATAGSDYSALSGSVTIPAGSSSATIPLTVIDDFIVEPSETVDVTLSVGPGTYTVVLPWAASATIADNDVASFQVSAISGHTTESGGPATFTVRLTSVPSAQVSIALASNNTAEGTVSPSGLTFDSGDWNVPKTVTVTGVNDSVTDGNKLYQITLGPAVSGDPNYSGKPITPVDVINDDNEPEITIVATTPNASEPSTNGVFTVTRTGSLAGTLTVNYTVSGTATPGADYNAMTGTLNFPATLASQTIIVPVINDSIVEPAETVIVTISPSANYTVASPSQATVTISDDDVAGFVVSGISGHTDENLGTATFTVRLTSQPSANVQVTATTSLTSEGLVSSAAFPSPASSVTLTFTSLNWNSNQVVTVTGQNDNVTDPSHLYQINLGPAVSGDGNYSGKTLSPVAVINDDNEPEVSVAVTTMAAEPSTNGVFTLSRTGNNGASLTVNYTMGGSATAGTDYTTPSGSATFAPGASTTTVIIGVINDSIVEGLKTINLFLSASANYTIGSPSGGIMTLTDDDTAGVVVSAISGHTTEGGRGDGRALEPHVQQRGLEHPQDRNGHGRQRFQHGRQPGLPDQPGSRDERRLQLWFVDHRARQRHQRRQRAGGVDLGDDAGGGRALHQRRLHGEPHGQYRGIADGELHGRRQRDGGERLRDSLRVGHDSGRPALRHHHGRRHQRFDRRGSRDGHCDPDGRALGLHGGDPHAGDGHDHG